MEELSGLQYSIVIPAFNEAENIPTLTEELFDVARTHLKDFEILFVNDGSRDATERVLLEIEKSYPCVRHISLAKNKGQTSALRAGFTDAKGRFIITLDCDLQNDPRDIPRLLSFLGDHDCVCGVRRQRKDSFLRRLSSTIANAIRNACTGDDIVDVGCSLRIMKKDAVCALPLFKGMHRFLPTLLRWNGSKIAQIEVSHRARKKGRAKYGFCSRLGKATTDLFVVMWMRKNWISYTKE